MICKKFVLEQIKNAAEVVNRDGLLKFGGVGLLTARVIYFSRKNFSEV